MIESYILPIICIALGISILVVVNVSTWFDDTLTDYCDGVDETYPLTTYTYSSLKRKPGYKASTYSKKWRNIQRQQ